jgi:hypothetical protein
MSWHCLWLALFIDFVVVWWYWGLLRVSYLLGKYSATWTTSPAFFDLVYFSDRVLQFCLGPVLVCNPPTSLCLPRSCDYRHAYHGWLACIVSEKKSVLFSGVPQYVVLFSLWLHSVFSPPLVCSNLNMIHIGIAVVWMCSPKIHVLET